MNNDTVSTSILVLPDLIRPIKGILAEYSYARVLIKHIMFRAKATVHKDEVVNQSHFRQDIQPLNIIKEFFGLDGIAWSRTLIRVKDRPTHAADHKGFTA